MAKSFKDNKRVPRYMVFEENSSEGEVTKHYVETLGPVGFTQVGLYGSLTKTPHYTCNQIQFEKDRGSSNVRYYPLTASSVDGRHGLSPDDRNFVNVWNRNTPEFKTGRLASIVNKLPFDEMLNKHVSGKGCLKSINKRGNYQISYGFASGQSLQKRDEENVRQHFGAAMPCVLTDTKDNVDLMITLSELCREVGTAWHNDELMAKNPEVFEEINFVMETIDPRVREMLVTVAHVCLDGNAGIKKHVDAQNGIGLLSQVMVAKRVHTDKDGVPWVTSFIVNQKRCVGESLLRKNIALQTNSDMVGFLFKIDRFRLPDTSVADFAQYGAGTFGVFVSRCKETGTFTSAALQSRPAMNKNVFFLSGIVSAVMEFQSESGQDFYLQDGIAICLSLTCFCNTEALVQALKSGSLRQVWSSRKDEIGGVLGLLFKITGERNGSINHGKGHTRRCQPWLTGTNGFVDCERYISLVDTAVKECIRSHKRMGNTPCDSKEYDRIVLLFQDAMGKNKNVSLGIQHFTHVIHRVGYLNAPGLHRYAFINPNNSNGSELQQYLGGERSNAAKKSKMLILQKQNEVFLSQIFKPECVSMAVIENIHCERIREGKKNPFVAVDLTFPGQTFTTFQEDGGEYYQAFWQIRWSETSGRFKSVQVGSTGPGIQPNIGSLGGYSIKTGQLALNGGVGSPREEQLFVPASSMDCATKLRIKKLIFQAKDANDTHQEHFHKICQLVGAEVVAVLEGNGPSRPKRQAAKDAWQVQADKWNSSKPTLLSEAMTRQQGKTFRKVLPTTTTTGVKVNKASTIGKALKRKPKPGKNSDTMKVVARVSEKEIDSLMKEPLIQFPELTQKTTESVPYDSPKRLLLLDCDTAPKKKPRRSRWDVKPNEHPKEDGNGKQFQDGNDVSGKASEQPQPLGDNLSVTHNDQDCNEDTDFASTLHSEESSNTWEESSLERNPVSTRTRSQQGDQSLPIIKDRDGSDRTLDWTDRNITDISIARSISSLPQIRRASYDTQATASHIMGNSFRQFSGCRDLYEKKDLVRYKCPNLLDLGRNCLNSQEKVIPENLSNEHFSYPALYNEDRRVFKCKISLIEGIDDYFNAGDCFLCDMMAEMLLGEKFLVSEASTKFTWGFQTPSLARNFVLLCLIMTTGTSQFYKDLHRTARKTYGRSLQAAQEMATTAANKSKLEQLKEEDYFVVGFGDSCCTEIPFFYVIGNWKHHDKPHRRHSALISNDFCLVVTDLGLYRRHYAEGTKKPTKNFPPGKAAFIRPIRREEE